MSPAKPPKSKLAVLRGTLDIFILRAVSGRALHGFEITVWLEEQTAGALDVDDSALYQALHRLEARGYIEGDWGVSEKNRRARYYAITRSGRKHLADETSRLMSYANTITALLSPRKS
jgi:PadR family transcriptional regulator PadR